LARQQISALRGKAKASLIVAVDDIRRRGCAAAGVRLTGPGMSGICRLSLYGELRLLTVFEASDRAILLLVAGHTRTSNPYQLLYDILGIEEPERPRTKPTCCDPEGHPSVDADLAARLENGLRQLAQATRSAGQARGRRR
jgi:hypothetical protein